MQRVQAVNNCALAATESNPQVIILTAVGIVPSSGWTNPTLVNWYYVTPPEDGIQDFDFCANTPTGIVIPVELPLTAETMILTVQKDYWGTGKPLVGVRIHARTNSVEARLDEKPVETATIQDGRPWPFIRPELTFDGRPWPFSWRNPLTEGRGGWPLGPVVVWPSEKKIEAGVHRNFS